MRFVTGLGARVFFCAALFPAFNAALTHRASCGLRVAGLHSWRGFAGSISCGIRPFATVREGPPAFGSTTRHWALGIQSLEPAARPASPCEREPSALQSPVRSPLEPLSAFCIDPTTFRQVESEHFILATAGGRQAAQRILDEMEEVYTEVDGFRRLRGWPAATGEARRLPVLLLGRDEDYGAICSAMGKNPGEVVGVYHECSGLTVLRDSMGASGEEANQRSASLPAVGNAPRDAPARGVPPPPRDEHPPFDEVARRLVLRHEAAHQSLAVYYPMGIDRVRPWMKEGLACLFEPAPAMGTDGAFRVNAPRLEDLRQFLRRFGAISGDASHPRVTEDANRWKALAAALDSVIRNESSDEFGELSGPEFYAVSWGLAYFLQRPLEGKTNADGAAPGVVPPAPFERWMSSDPEAIDGLDASFARDFASFFQNVE